MKILIAKTSGFCMGVRRAVEMVLDAPGKRQKPIFTYGPLIHNPQVLSLLKEKGISVLDGIPGKGQGTILVRAHGVPPKAKSDLAKAGFTVIDATCPRVIRVQTIIKKHAKRGYDTVIIGDSDAYTDVFQRGGQNFLIEDNTFVNNGLSWTTVRWDSGTSAVVRGNSFLGGVALGGGVPSSRFSNNYWAPPAGVIDHVGHPNTRGYNILGNEFHRILGAKGAPGAAQPVGPTGEACGEQLTLTWEKETQARSSCGNWL